MTAGRATAAVGLLASLGLAGGFVYLAVRPAPAPPPAADLVLDATGADLGPVLQNQTLIGKYALVNNLPEAVAVEMVAKSCSCAEAEVAPTHIGPGERATLTVAWKTGQKRGKVADRVTVVAGCPSGRKLVRELVLRADVQPDYTVTPAELRFGPDGGEATLRFAPTAGADVRLLDAVTGVGGLTVRADAAGTVIVRCPPGLTVSNPLAVMLRTTSVNQPTLQVPVMVASE